MFSREFLAVELDKYKRAEAEFLDLAKLNHGAALAIQALLDDFDAAGEGAASAAPLIPQEVGADE